MENSELLDAILLATEEIDLFDTTDQTAITNEGLSFPELNDEPVSNSGSYYEDQFYFDVYAEVLDEIAFLLSQICWDYT